LVQPGNTSEPSVCGGDGPYVKLLWPRLINCSSLITIMHYTRQINRHCNNITNGACAVKVNQQKMLCKMCYTFAGAVWVRLLPNYKKRSATETIINMTRMWADAERDGRPVEYRWRPLFNAAKFVWRPLPECRAVTLPGRKRRWN